MIAKPKKTCHLCGGRNGMKKGRLCAACRNGRGFKHCTKLPLCEEPREETFEWDEPEHAARFAEVKRVPKNKTTRWALPTIAVASIPVRRGKRR